MTASFDEVIFLLSTDCFSHEVLRHLPEQEVEQITAIARDVALQILNGGKNYFICADFSPSRIEKTKMLFFDTARKLACMNSNGKKLG